jgi:uncharacterized protein (TIGR03435 family)
MEVQMRVTLLAFAAVALAAAQQPARVEYEAVSVKPGDPLDGSSSGKSTVGGMEMHNTTLNTLVRSAYGLNEFQLYGGPKWVNTAKFDVIAKYPVGAANEQKPLMMRAMLADRFKLVAHRETRTLAQYDLVVAKGGPKLEASSAEDAAQTRSSQGPRQLKVWGADMAMLARMLIGAVDAPVRDKTGLDGKYNINMAFAPMQGATAEDDARPSVFAAVQLLGLKLEPVKGPVEAMVIDSAEMPEGN